MRTLVVLVVSGTRHGRPDVAYWLSRWARRHGLPGALIVGCARGVDRQAIAWARGYRVPVDRHVADWSRGARAGHERNARMVAAAPVGSWLLAFPDVESRGTYDAVRRARRAGLRVWICAPAWPARSSLLPALCGPVRGPQSTQCSSRAVSVSR